MAVEKILNTIKSQIPKEVNGFFCIKTQEILIPHMEIGIECLIHDISELNLFFETILKLVEIEVKEISSIARILGVSFDTVKEAVVDMVSGDYISVSANILGITKKGKEVLKSKKLIEIKKKNLNKVMVNLITGEISDGSNVKTASAGKSSVCLAEEIAVNKSFLDTNYSSINQVYQVQQENDSAYGRKGITKELYKIVDISYRKLVYLANEVVLYKSDDSVELQIQFTTDANDTYSNCLYRQLKGEIHPCLENFFEKSRDFVKKLSAYPSQLDQALNDVAKKVKAELYDKANVADVDLSLFENRRYALVDKEYIDYFTHSDEFRFDRLFIYTNRINSMLNPEVFSEIERISEKKKVVILYDKKEFHAMETIKHFLGKKQNKNLFIIPSDSVDKTIICFDQALIIEVKEEIVYMFEKPICYKVPIVDFDKSKLKPWVEEIQEEYDLKKILQPTNNINNHQKSSRNKG